MLLMPAGSPRSHRHSMCFRLTRRTCCWPVATGLLPDASRPQPISTQPIVPVPIKTATRLRWHAQWRSAQICDGLPLVPAVKSMVAYLEDDEAYARVMPPFLPLAETDRSLLIQRYHAVEDAASGATSMVH